MSPPKTPPSEFRAIRGEVTIHNPHDLVTGDDEDGVRLYCTSNPMTHGEENAWWALQVRARVKTRSRGQGKRFAIGTAAMSREDLLWLRRLIDNALR